MDIYRLAYGSLCGSLFDGRVYRRGRCEPKGRRCPSPLESSGTCRWLLPWRSSRLLVRRRRAQSPGTPHSERPIGSTRTRCTRQTASPPFPHVRLRSRPTGTTRRSGRGQRPAGGADGCRRHGCPPHRRHRRSDRHSPQEPCAWAVVAPAGPISCGPDTARTRRSSLRPYAPGGFDTHAIVRSDLTDGAGRTLKNTCTR